MKPMSQPDSQDTACINEAVEKIRDRILDGVDRVEKTAQLAASRAQVNLMKASAELRSVVHRYPLTSMLVTAGLGCVIGGLPVYLASEHQSGTPEVPPITSTVSGK